MEINKKELYLSPEVKTFEVKQEGVICASNPKYNIPFEKGEDW